MKKNLFCILLITTTISLSFAIPAKPFKLLAPKDISYLYIKGFDEQKTIEPVFFKASVAEPIKTMNNSKISFKIALDENYKVKLTWVSANGHQAKRYIIQCGYDKELFYDLDEIMVLPNPEEKMLYTFTDPRAYSGTKYYRIVEKDEADKTFIYAPVKMTVEALQAPAELVKCLQTEENNVIHIKTADSRLVPILTTDTGMGIPCDYKYSEATQTGVLKPVYYLAGGNYHLKVRLGNNESKYMVTVADLEGNQF
ncbi:MAG: hypothetical protein U5N85_07110 [Arcicella sp.]|nr:hypothetical protein [Arcicella sp.]